VPWNRLTPRSCYLGIRSRCSARTNTLWFRSYRVSPSSQTSILTYAIGLLMNLKECGSAELDSRTTRTRPTSLRSSDKASLLRYMGLRESLLWPLSGRVLTAQLYPYLAKIPSSSRTSHYSRSSPSERHHGLWGLPTKSSLSSGTASTMSWSM
jgi:hypothetical protein